MKALFVVLMISLVAACSSMDSYKKAGSDVQRGGAQDQAAAASLARQKQLAAERIDIEDKTMSVKRDLQRMDQRIAAAQDDSKRSDMDLQAALDQKRVTKARYDALKAEQDSVKAELASLQRKDNVDQRQAKPDPKAEADKQKKLDALKARQKTLQDTLSKALATGG